MNDEQVVAKYESILYSLHNYPTHKYIFIVNATQHLRKKMDEKLDFPYILYPY